jgi:hypothetical protein
LIFVPHTPHKKKTKYSTENKTSHLDGRDGAVLGEHVSQFLLGQVLAKVLDEDVGEALRLLAQLHLALFAGDEPADEHLAERKQNQLGKQNFSTDGSIIFPPTVPYMEKMSENELNHLILVLL